jgi:hypothetical protein
VHPLLTFFTATFHAANSNSWLAQESCSCFPVLYLLLLLLLLKNAEANVIYLETPAGVGYSYSADAAYYQGVDDKMTGTEHSVLL